jgi:vesicle-associated membrane protein 7
MASIIYAVIASDSNPTPLAEVSLAEGNFGMLALKLLTKIRKDNSASYVYENKYIFHYNNQFDVTFLCMTDAAFHNRTAYAFLFDIKEKFFEKYGNNVKHLIGYGANKEFGEQIKQKMHFYNSDQGGNDKLKTVRENIEKTKDIMIENIDKVLARGEKIELLVNKTQQLSDSSVSMRKTVKNI